MASVLTGMNARILTTATLFTAFAGVLTATAADSQLLGLVMPDAKVLIGINVDQAKASPFGLYLLTQIQSGDSGMKDLVALTGFDPTRDVHEILAASNAMPGAQGPVGLVTARGNFDPAAITALAASKGAATEVYGTVTILEDPKQTFGIAFLNPTLVIAGDVASVKGAIDRPSSGQALPSAVMSQVSQWSGSQDAWILITVPLGTLAPGGTGTAALPGALGAAQGIFQQVQQVAAGVKFGNSVVGTAAIQADTAQNAAQMANALQFLVNMAQMQGGQTNAQLASLAKGLVVGAQGNTVKITITMPQAQFQQLIQTQKANAIASPARGAIKK